MVTTSKLRCRRYCGVRPAPPKNHRGGAGFCVGRGLQAYKPRAGVLTVSPIKAARVETVFGQASAAQSSLLASATCSGGAPPAGRQRPVGRFERSHVGAQALESLRGDAHLQLIIARVQG